jgi:hypothetical protein
MAFAKWPHSGRAAIARRSPGQHQTASQARGPGAARTATLAHATGNYAFRVDADNVIDQQVRVKLEALHDSLRNASPIWEGEPPCEPDKTASREGEALCEPQFLPWRRGLIPARVSTAAVTHFAISGPSRATQGVGFKTAVSAVDDFGNVNPGIAVRSASAARTPRVARRTSPSAKTTTASTFDPPMACSIGWRACRVGACDRWRIR